MKQWVLAVLAVLILPSFAQAEDIWGGSIVILKYTRERASIAADSRVNMVRMVGNQGYRDDYCKIVTLSNNFLFVSAGAQGLETRRFGASWSVNELAGGALRTVTLLGLENIVEETARRWMNSLSFHMKQIAPSLRKAVLQEVGNRILVQGIFIGVEKGSVSAWRASILEVNSLVRGKLQALEPSIAALGRSDIFHEFVIEETNPSERAKAERANWEHELVSKDPAERDILTVIRLVDLTIAFESRSETVGGPIDAVELTRDGKIHWFQRKANCLTN